MYFSTRCNLISILQCGMNVIRFVFFMACLVHNNYFLHELVFWLNPCLYRSVSHKNTNFYVSYESYIQKYGILFFIIVHFIKIKQRTGKVYLEKEKRQVTRANFYHARVNFFLLFHFKNLRLRCLYNSNRMVSKNG